MKQQNKDGVREPLAQDVPATKSEMKLDVSSPVFGNGEKIPAAHSAYDQNFSPALRWSGAPDGTKSFVLMMEDPDAKVTPLPVLHWIAWNIPGSTFALPEGIPASEGVTDPKDMRQGPNYSGKPGYAGPKPPAGDAPHRYFFQVYALDRLLDLPLNAGRDQLLKAVEGHVVAKGSFHGTFVRPADPAKP